MKRVLLIGAGSAIAKALLIRLGETPGCAVDLVSRTPPSVTPAYARYLPLAEYTDDGIGSLCQQLLEERQHYDLVVCCTGLLHETGLMPEKRLEDLQSQALQRYFWVNSVLPALWLKHLLALLKGKIPSTCVFFSARVGSIADNRLGGWYGYRASKAALNMLIKTAQVEYARRAPNVRLLSYHPGTVDSPLSQPFQANVPRHKLFTPAQAADYLLAALASLPPTPGPHFIDWQGNLIPW